MLKLCYGTARISNSSILTVNTVTARITTAVTGNIATVVTVIFTAVTVNLKGFTQPSVLV